MKVVLGIQNVIKEKLRYEHERGQKGNGAVQGLNRVWWRVRVEWERWTVLGLEWKGNNAH